MSRDTWDPAQYAVYSDERSRAFFELTARMRPPAPRRVVDLGCGSGELTATLADRWPGAEVLGLDSSASMIGKARGHERPGLGFAVGDLATWRPEAPVDVIVSNAAFQWVPGHVELLPVWVRSLAPGGVLAFQVPGNFDAPSHTLLREMSAKHGVGDVLRWRPVLDPAEYLDLLAGLGCRVDAWETTYLQVLPGKNAVLEWVKGTALRPVLAALDDPAAFLSDYSAALDDAYPPGPNGTVFPFRRIFVVATNP
ncbi:trans-aconitate 2-methyltransferase [Actinocorallia longicatena]|uniref:Trans-aconitate 2-methyltransferase n=1 Tax=Actinocorallia longicatena TaxID=111803 RepID=A0ABP6Q3H1_9ACTN